MNVYNVTVYVNYLTQYFIIVANDEISAKNLLREYLDKRVCPRYTLDDDDILITYVKLPLIPQHNIEDILYISNILS